MNNYQLSIKNYQFYKDSAIAWLGDVPEHWEVRRVKELSITISKGTTPSTEGFTFVDQGIRFIKAENITNTKSISQFPIFYINEEANQTLLRSQLKWKDLLIVIAGATIGKIGIVDQELLPANTNQAVCFIRFKRFISVDFLYYLFASDYFFKYVWFSIVQSAQPNLSMGVLGNFLLFIPTASEQKLIAAYLDAKTAQ
jgi:type I restriction enzyme S subunit